MKTQANTYIQVSWRLKPIHISRSHEDSSQYIYPGLMRHIYPSLMWHISWSLESYIQVIWGIYPGHLDIHQCLTRTQTALYIRVSCRWVIYPAQLDIYPPHLDIYPGLTRTKTPGESIHPGLIRTKANTYIQVSWCIVSWGIYPGHLSHISSSTGYISTSSGVVPFHFYDSHGW